MTAANAANVARCIDILRKLLASHEQQLDLIDDGIEYQEKVLKFIQRMIHVTHSLPHICVCAVYECMMMNV